MTKRIYDYSKLKGRLREMNMTQSILASIIGISDTSLNFKLNNVTFFRQNEIIDIVKALNIPYNEISDYFFKY